MISRADSRLITFRGRRKEISDDGHYHCLIQDRSELKRPHMANTARKFDGQLKAE